MTPISNNENICDQNVLILETLNEIMGYSI